ncbi:MAG: hypothetical protein ACYSSM_03235 [Planctomycetota bacterium]
MKYTDWDMKMMALGEIGADFMAIIVSVGVWIYLDDMSWLLKIPAIIVTQRIVAYLALGFVHLGYDPEEQEEPQ